MGDSLIQDAGGHYEKIKKCLKEEKTDNTDNRMYMDKHYAVKIFSPGIYEGNNIPAVILESLVEALNHNAKVPHTIIVAWNDKKFWNNKDLLKSQMKWIIKKFFKEFQKILDERKYALDDKAVNWDYPRLMVTRPLPLPSNLPSEHYPKGFRSNRRKFNKILDQDLKENRKYSIINLAGFTSQNKEKFFNINGQISEKGYDHFWREINDAVHSDDDKTRVLANKLKAKKLAQELSDELMLSEDSDTELTASTVKHPVKQNPAPAARKSLRQKFDASEEQCDSPSQARNNDDRRVNRTNLIKHHKPAQRQFHGFFQPRRRYNGFNPYFHDYHPHGYPRPRFFKY